MFPTVAALAGVLIGAALVLLVQRASARPPAALGEMPQRERPPSSRRSARARFSPVGLSDVELAELELDHGTPDEQDEPAERRPYDDDDEPPEEPGR